MAGTGTLTVTPDTGSSAISINTLPPSGQATGANSLPVVVASDQNAIPFKQLDVLATGTIASATANAAYTVALANGEGVLGFAISGLTASGATLTAEAANDGGTTWAPINLVAPGTGALSTTVSADGNYRVNAGGHTNVRLRVSTTGTGTINVASIASSQNPLVALSGPVTQTADQDPVYDHANGKRVSVTASTLVITPPTGCKYLRISCDSDVVLNTAGSAAVDDGTSIRLVANQPEVIPVVATVGVYALSLSGSAAVVRATPMKVR